jgi:hypothetical protein
LPPFETIYLTNDIAGGSSFQAFFLMLEDAEICDARLWSFIDGRGADCFDVYIKPNESREYQESRTGRPSMISWTVNLERNSNSTPIATWEVKLDNPDVKLPEPSQKGWYVMPADGKSTAEATLNPEIAGNVENP